MNFLRRLSTSQIARNASWLLSANLLISASNFIGSVVVIRYLGIEGYGHIVVALAVVNMLSPLILQNSERLVIFAVAEERMDGGTIVGTMGALMALAAVPCAALIAVLPWTGLYDARVLFALIGLSILPLPLRVLRPFLLFKGRANVNFWSDCWMAATGLAGRLLLVAGGAGLGWFGGVIFLQNLVAALVLILLSRHLLPADKLKFDRGLAYRTFQQSWPIIFTSFVTAIAAQLDRVALGQFGSAAAVGLLGVFAQLILPMRIIASSITAARLPRLVAGGISDAAKFQAEAERGLALNVSVAVVLGLAILVSLPLIEMLLAADLTSHWYIFGILILGYIVSIPAQYRLEYAMTIGAERHYFMVSTIAAAVGIVLVFVLVRQLGLLGAALSSPALSLLVNIIGIYSGSRMAIYRPIFWQSLVKGLSLTPLLTLLGRAG